MHYVSDTTIIFSFNEIICTIVLVSKLYGKDTAWAPAGRPPLYALLADLGGNPPAIERRSYREPRAASSLIAAALSCAACASRRITSTVSSPAIVPASPSNSSQSIPYATACAAPLSVLTTIRLPTASADTKSVGRIVSNGAMFSHSSGSV